MRGAIIGLGLLIAAAPASALAQNEPTPPPELEQAGMAFGACIEAAVDTVAANIAPGTAARDIVATCAPQRARVNELHSRWIDSLTISESEKREARAAMAESWTRIEPQLVALIQRRRADD